MKTESQKIIIELKSLRYFWGHFNRVTYRFMDRTENEEQTTKIRNARVKLFQAMSELDAVYAEQIGKAIVSEI